MQKVSYKISHDEINFMLSHIPAFGALSDIDKQIYTSVMGKLAARQGSLPQKFRFLKHKNDGMAVPCIKLIRAALGVGLKEAKDMWDAEATFSLSAWKMSKEQLEANIKTVIQGGKMLDVEWL